MTDQNAINSGKTTLRITEEISYGVVDGSAVWTQLEPNSYGAFGGKNTMITRDPINAARRRVKGGIVDREAQSAFNVDLTQHNQDLILPGLLFANWRYKGVELVTAVALDTTNPDEYLVASTAGFLVGNLIKGQNFANAANNAINRVTVITSNTAVKVADGQLIAEGSPPATAQIVVIGHQAAAGDIDVTTSGAYATYTSTALDFTTLGLIVGEEIFVGGDAAGTFFSNAANNGFKRIRSIAANALVVDQSALAMITESSTTETIQFYFGKVLKDEDADNKVQHSFQLERSLDAPDPAAPSQIQAEYTIGAIYNSATINIPVAGKVTIDVDFLPTHAEYRTATDGRKAGTRPVLSPEGFFNTSSNFKELKLAVNDASAEAASSFFSFLTEIKLTLDNQGKLQKAVGVLGGFDVSLDDQIVRAETTGYFKRVEVLSAIANNADINMHIGMVARNAGVWIDLPLGGSAGNPLTVAKGGKVMQPLTIEFGDSSQVATGFGHQILITSFEYLPNLATPVVA